MRPYSGTVLNVNQPLSEALLRADKSSELLELVEDGRGKWYGITKGELRRQARQMQKGSTLRSVLSPESLPHLHPDNGLEEALQRLGDWPLLPVVNRADFRKLEGVVGLHDIAAAYHATREVARPGL